MNECPICGASVAVARQFQHKRWHHEDEVRRQALEATVERLQRDLRHVLKRLARADERAPERTD